jgi:hypothetical protein
VHSILISQGLPIVAAKAARQVRIYDYRLRVIHWFCRFVEAAELPRDSLRISAQKTLNDTIGGNMTRIAEQQKFFIYRIRASRLSIPVILASHLLTMALLTPLIC